QQRRLGQATEVVLLDGLRGADDDRRSCQPVASERCLDARAAPRELFLYQASVEVAGPRAAVLLGDVGVHETNLPSLLDDLLRPRPVAVVVPRHRANLPDGKVVGHLAEVPLLVSEREIDHSAALLTGAPGPG